MPRMFELVLSCEHASARVPEAYRKHFRGVETVLRSHEGFDLGALALAEALGRRFATPVSAAEVSRLVVDTNRSPNNPQVISRYLRGLDSRARVRLIAAYHTPHRQAVAARVAAGVAGGRRVLHIGVHSFTPNWKGHVRNCDVGLLYDPRRPTELDICRRWQSLLRRTNAELRVRRNAPYRGTDDGLTRSLRRCFSDRAYAGIELEVNQAMATDAAPERTPWFQALADTLSQILSSRGVGATGSPA